MQPRRPTIADVAREAGVAASTASIVFSGKAGVSDATRERVLSAANTLGYTGPDPRAASLRRGRSGIVAVVFEEQLGAAFLDPVKRLMMDGLTAAVAPLGAGLLLLHDDAFGATEDAGAAADTDSLHDAHGGAVTDDEAADRGGVDRAESDSGDDPDPDRTDEPDSGAEQHPDTPPLLTTTPIDAAVLVGCSARVRESLEVLRGRGVPVVVIEADAGAGVPQIRLDNREAQQLAAVHLRELGHTRVATVTLPTDDRSGPGWIGPDPVIMIDVTAERLEGVRAVFPQAPAYAAAASSIDEGLAAGRVVLADPATRPTAVLAQSDLLAAGVIRAAEEVGLRVPEDVSVTGFDGVRVDGLAPYELTTLVQEAVAKGRLAGEAIATMLAGRTPASTRLACTFRKGDTTGPVPHPGESDLSGPVE
ncbi:LacI family DNA-binding transcriptional regulator [Microbacterium sp. MC2]